MRDEVEEDEWIARTCIYWMKKIIYSKCGCMKKKKFELIGDNVYWVL